jgi:hypothetical protein
MSLVDLEYEPLRLHDPTMAGILVVSWLFISGILFINLFIGKATVAVACVCVFFGLRPLIYVKRQYIAYMYNTI